MERPAAFKRTVPRENLAGAIVAGLRYIRFSPQIKAVMERQGAAMFFASGLLALLPSLAHNVSSSAIGYGILLGVFGAGAVLGAMALQPLPDMGGLKTSLPDIFRRVGGAVRETGYGRRENSATGRRLIWPSMVGLQRSFISRLETGLTDPCLRSLETVADGFELSISQLICGL